MKRLIFVVFYGFSSVFVPTIAEATSLGSFTFDCASETGNFPSEDLAGLIGDTFTMTVTGGTACDVNPVAFFNPDPNTLTYSISGGGSGTFVANTPVSLASGQTMTVALAANGTTNLFVSNGSNLNISSTGINIAPALTACSVSPSTLNVPQGGAQYSLTATPNPGTVVLTINGVSQGQTNFATGLGTAEWSSAKAGTTELQQAYAISDVSFTTPLCGITLIYAAAVPTLSEWAQLMLALMVIGIAWHFHNNRQNSY